MNTDFDNKSSTLADDEGFKAINKKVWNKAKQY